MMKYKFGVMSNKWELEAEDKIHAHIAMVIHVGQNVPIAVFEPEGYLIDCKKTLEENQGTFNPDRVKKILKTIKCCGA